MANGINLKLTHTTESVGNLYPHDVNLPFIIPYGGTVTVLYTSDVAKSFDSGSIRGFLEAGYVTVEFVLGTEFHAATAAARVQLLSNSSFTNYDNLSDALAASNAGDTVIFRPGLYPESITIPHDVRVYGTGPSLATVITGSDATSTRVTFSGTGMLRQCTVLAPSSGMNPAVDCSAAGASDNIVLHTVVSMGQGGVGHAFNLGSDAGMVLFHSCYHNGGHYGGDYVHSDGANAVVSNGFAHGGSVGGSYWDFQTGCLQFLNNWMLRETVTSAATVVRAGENSKVMGKFTVAQPSNVTTGLWIDGDGVELELLGCDFKASTTDFLISSGLTGVGTRIYIQSCNFRQEKVVNNAGAVFFENVENLVQYLDQADFDDPTLRIGGELSVGATFRQAEMTVGEGDSTTQGMYIFSDDGTGTSFSDLTPTLKSRDGSTTPLFQGTAAGNVFYVGNGSRRFPGIEPLINTAMVWDGAVAVWEFWDTSIGDWAVFDVMYREDAGDGTSYGQEVFVFPAATKQTKIDFCSTAEDPNWGTTSVDGTLAYWVRMRLTTGFGVSGVVPVCERVKLSVNNVEIDSRGIQFAGVARPKRKLLVHLSLADDLSGASPASETISFSPNIQVTPVDNEFINGQNDGLGGIVYIDKGLDTSAPLNFRVGWAPHNNNAGELDLKLYVADPILVGSNIDNSAIPETLYEDSWDTQQPGGLETFDTTPTELASTQDLLYISEISFSIPDSVPDTAFAFALRRNDADVNDSYTGNAKIVFIEIDGRFWHL